MLKRGDKNEARFFQQNEVMAANLDLLRMHLHRQPNANTKLDLPSPIFDSGSAQVVETSVKVTPNSPSQDYSHPDDHNLRTYDMTPGFKPFTVLAVITLAHL